MAKLSMMSMMKKLLTAAEETAKADNAWAEHKEVFIDAYVVAALWSSTDDSRPDGGDPLDANYSCVGIDDDTLKAMRKDCEIFLRGNYLWIEEDDFRRPKDGGQFGDVRDHYSGAGHDFWLTRNHHGAGFWDGDWPKHGDDLSKACEVFPEIDLYVQDGKIYA